MKSSNLPPGCTNEDIERAAGSFDEEPEEEQDEPPDPEAHQIGCVCIDCHHKPGDKIADNE